jgi:hypothetical protein
MYDQGCWWTLQQQKLWPYTVQYFDCWLIWGGNSFAIFLTQHLGWVLYIRNNRFSHLVQQKSFLTSGVHKLIAFFHKYSVIWYPRQLKQLQQLLDSLIAVYMEAIPLCLFLNKPHFFSLTQHMFILIQKLQKVYRKVQAETCAHM